MCSNVVAYSNLTLGALLGSFFNDTSAALKHDDETALVTDSRASPCGPDIKGVCTGGELCRPLNPQPSFKHEVVAYHADGAYGANGSEYALYDYSKVTAIADYSWLYANQTICTAHLHGVRVLGFNMYDMGALFSADFYTNDTTMVSTRSSITVLQACRLQIFRAIGLSIDIEDP